MVNTTELRKVNIKVDIDLVLQGGAGVAPLTRRASKSFDFDGASCSETSVQAHY